MGPAAFLTGGMGLLGQSATSAATAGLGFQATAQTLEMAALTSLHMDQQHDQNMANANLHHTQNISNQNQKLAMDLSADQMTLMKNANQTLGQAAGA